MGEIETGVWEGKSERAAPLGVKGREGHAKGREIEGRNPNFLNLYRRWLSGLAWACWALAFLEASLIVCPPLNIDLWRWAP